MAELFQTTRNNITLHIGNIFKEGELEDSAVRKESLLTAADGKKYKTKFYNLDVIISVGSSEHDKIKTPFVADSPIMQVKRQKNTKTFGRLKLKHYLCNPKKHIHCELS